MKKQYRSKGQALVEFSLVFSLLVMIILFFIDPCLYLFNLHTAEQYASMAAREASVYKADGTHTCKQMVNNVIGLGPPFIMVDPGNWSLTVAPCSNDPSWTTPTGTYVVATMTFHQEQVFSQWLLPETAKVILQDIFQ